MKDAELRCVAQMTGAKRARRSERIQSLWSGYGELLRVTLEGAAVESVIVKWVTPPTRDRAGARNVAHDVSHARKCRSYEVETAWYRSFAPLCNGGPRVARSFGSRTEAGHTLLVLEDLDAAGFSGRRRGRIATQRDLDVCLGWLAEFHARFLGVAPKGLWRNGTYWHLATRPDELAAIEDDALRVAAPKLDEMLQQCAFKTLVHGDAKLANFCFADAKSSLDEPNDVAAVDFQYVGGGCGMKDVAYLLTGDAGSDEAEQRHLDAYFVRLRAALAKRADATASSDIRVDIDALEREWRALYPIACADFYRFLAGWAKPHWSTDAHGQRVVQTVLRSLNMA